MCDAETSVGFRLDEEDTYRQRIGRRFLLRASICEVSLSALKRQRDEVIELTAVICRAIPERAIPLYDVITQ